MHGMRPAISFLGFTVVNQRYDPEVQNPGGFAGGNVLIKCNIPSFVRDYVTVTSWLQEPAFNIYPSLTGGEYILVHSILPFVRFSITLIQTKTHNLRLVRTLLFTLLSYGYIIPLSNVLLSSLFA